MEIIDMLISYSEIIGLSPDTLLVINFLFWLWFSFLAGWFLALFLDVIVQKVKSYFHPEDFR